MLLQQWQAERPGVEICPGSCLACRSVLTVIGTFYRAFDNFQLGYHLFGEGRRQAPNFRVAQQRPNA